MQFARIWRRAKWIGRGVLFFTPLTSFYMMQFVFGSMPWDHSLGVTLANYICIGAAFFLLTALTNRLLLCSLIVHLACIAWGVANYFVNLYRGLPILPWDFTALRTAVAVADSYDLYVTWEMGCCPLHPAGFRCPDPPLHPVRRSGAAAGRAFRPVWPAC